MENLMRMESKYKISIIIPVYNIDMYLARCIESVLAQVFQEWQLILVDDGSTDTSGEICDLYAKKDNRISVIHQKNSGVSVARNQGIQAASGDYISFLDGDDWIDEFFYQIFWDAIQQIEADVYVGSYQDVDMNGDKDRFQKMCMCTMSIEDALYNLLLGRFFDWVPVAKVYNRNLFKMGSCMFLDYQIMGEDLWFNWEILQKAKKIVYVPVDGYYYFHREGSAMNRPFKAQDCEIITITKRVCQDCREISWRHFLLAKCIYLGKLVGVGQKIIQADLDAQYKDLLKDIQIEIRKGIYCILLYGHTKVLTMRQRLGMLFFALPVGLRKRLRRYVLK